MTELDEMTDGKNLTELQKELEFQLANGESAGGTICSHILYHLEKAKQSKSSNMITDNSNGRLAEIKAFAKEHDLEESFNNTFSRLENYSAKGYDVTLCSDFAPLSLEFVIKEKERFVLNGGFIFHGRHDGFGSGGAPSFSVSLSQDKATGWSIHT